MTHKLLATGWIASLLAALAVGYSVHRPVATTATQATLAPTRKQQPPLVQVQQRVIQDSFRSAGNLTVDPDRESRVGSPLAGRVSAVYATVGDRVAAGAPLADITSPEITRMQAEYHHAALRLQQAQQSLAQQQQLVQLGDESRRPVEEARRGVFSSSSDAEVRRSQRELAERNLARAEELYKGGVAPLKELELSRAEWVQARSREEQARGLELLSRQNLQREGALAQSGARTGPRLAQLQMELRLAQEEVEHAAVTLHNLGLTPGGRDGRLTLKAPRGGRITTRTLTLGQAVLADGELFRVVDTSALWLWIHLREDELGRAKVGTRVTLSRGAAGRISYISPLLDPLTRGVEARVLVPNLHGELKPGMYVEATVQSGRSEKVLTLPASAVTVEGTGHLVYRPAGSGFQRVPVEVGRAGKGWLEVRSGLRQGDSVAQDAGRLAREGEL